MGPTPQDLLKLLRGEFSSLHITFNNYHAPNYEVASEEFYESVPGGDAITWASEEERQKAMAENSVWVIQWYPDTPNGFCCVGASTFEAAARFALSVAPDN